MSGVSRACPSGVHEATCAIRARGERCRARPPRRSVEGAGTLRARRCRCRRHDARRCIWTCARSWRTRASGRRRSQPLTPPTDLTTPRPTHWVRPRRPPSATEPTPGTRIDFSRDGSRSPKTPRRRTSSHDGLPGRGVGCGERTLRKPVFHHLLTRTRTLRLFLRRPVGLNLRLRFLSARELDRFPVHRECGLVLERAALVENQSDAPEHDACEEMEGERVGQSLAQESVTAAFSGQNRAGTRARRATSRRTVDGSSETWKGAGHGTHSSKGKGSRSAHISGRSPRSKPWQTPTRTASTRNTA